MSTRVDLTPMVDLGFLLITFFVFTTSLSQPKAFKLALPDERKTVNPMPVPEDKVLTLVLKNDRVVGYYYGSQVQQMQFTGYGTSLRNIIMQKQAAVTKMYGKPDGLTVLIKPMDNAVYKNVVDVLDEMRINGVKIYMLLDANKQENAIIATR